MSRGSITQSASSSDPVPAIAPSATNRPPWRGLPNRADLELLAVQTADRLGLRRPVPVRILSAAIGPAVFGLWRPVVVIPAVIVAGTLRVPSASSKLRTRHGERHTACGPLKVG